MSGSLLSAQFLQSAFKAPSSVYSCMIDYNHNTPHPFTHYVRI